jgi:hypothetical protein
MTEEDKPAPSWNTSTTVVRVIRDRLREQSWGACPTMQLPVYGPAPRLEERPLDLGEGLWR